MVLWKPRAASAAARADAQHKRKAEPHRRPRGIEDWSTRGEGFQRRPTEANRARQLGGGGHHYCRSKLVLEGGLGTEGELVAPMLSQHRGDKGRGWVESA
jgi:hypothetical protein